jgi:hypothetical protein
MPAKAIQISSDDITYHTLPGATGRFMSAAEGIQDTIFGNTYESNEIGLINWGMSANAYFKGFAGYLAKLKKPGTTTAMTTEAMTFVSGKTYQITNTAKRIFDRAATFTVFDNAVDHTADVDNIDYLFGKVTFKSSYTVTTPVTITGNYFPTTELGKGQSYTLTMNAAEIDATTFALAQANGGHKVHQPGLRTVALEIGGLFDATTDARSELVARNEVIIEIDPVGNGSSIARGFFKYAEVEQGGDVGALEEENLNFLLNTPIDPQITIGLYFGWEHTATTLAQAVQKLLDGYLNETLVYARYLPQGAIGQSPLDGKKGQCMVSDLSLSGGLSDMNTFAVELRGSGVVTEV